MAPRAAGATLCCAAVLVLAARADADAAIRTPRERLSDERTLSRWANPATRSTIRRAPARTGRPVGRLHLLTEDGQPEVYLALRRRREAGARLGIKVRIPARPNGQTGWVRRDALGPFHRVSTALVIDRRRSRATLHRSGRRIWQARIGHGAPGTPTPAGRFYIREKLRNLQRASCRLRSRSVRA